MHALSYINYRKLVMAYNNFIPFRIAGSRLQQLVVRGFRLATGAGPLCEEPMHGVAFVIEDISEFEAEQETDGPIIAANAGQVMSATAKACNRAMEEAGARIMLAMYTMDLMVRK